MTIYEIIKAAISVKQAAKHYGLNVNRNGMACCPFHNDRHPSLKLNEDYFFCFGCGAKGDVIDLVARLFDLSSYEAAQKLAADFGLDPKPPTAAAMVKPKRPYIRQFRENEMLCFRVLTDYLHLLEDWKIRYRLAAGAVSGGVRREQELCPEPVARDRPRAAPAGHPCHVRLPRLDQDRVPAGRAP